MDRRAWIYGIALLTVACGPSRPATPPPAFPPETLKAALGWIEGTWEDVSGTGVPYEVYRFESDTVLTIRNYEDRLLTRVRDSSRVYWRDSVIVHETRQNRWVAVRADSLGIQFESPEGAHPHFTWQRESATAWTATLETSRKPLVFRLERVR